MVHFGKSEKMINISSCMLYPLFYNIYIYIYPEVIYFGFTSRVTSIIIRKKFGSMSFYWKSGRQKYFFSYLLYNSDGVYIYIYICTHTNWYLGRSSIKKYKKTKKFVLLDNNNRKCQKKPTINTKNT